MKKRHHVIASILLSTCTLLFPLFFASCDQLDDLGNGSSVVIKGRFQGAGGLTGALLLDRFIASVFTTAYALDPTMASKVIIFMAGGHHEISNVTNGSFAIEAETGSPVGLIFVGASNNFLGYLSLSNGIESLPLTNVADNVTTIDLGTLSTSGLVVEPGRNLLGAELSLSLEEQTALAHGDDFFASVVRNPDVDGNGIIDFLEGRFYRPFITYFVNGGSFVNGVTPSIHTPARIDGHRFCVGINDNEGNLPSVIYFTGPQGSELSNAPSEPGTNHEANSMSYGSPYVNNPSIPLAGTYSISYKTKTLIFNIASQSAAPSNIILAVPTLVLNENQTINRINWVYKLGSGGDALNPQSIIESIELQISGRGIPCSNYPQQGRIYNSGMLSANTTGHLLSCQNLQWQDVDGIGMAYNDVYGNHYVVTWSHSNQSN